MAKPNITIDVKVEGLQKLKTQMRRHPQIAAPIMQKFITAGAAVLAKHTTKGNVPWDTGTMTQTFKLEMGDLRAAWFPTRKYAIFVHEGTSPHIIRVKTKKVLANKKTGEIFGTEVKHPGTKPQPFMETIAKKSEPEIERLAEQAAEKIADKIAKR